MSDNEVIIVNGLSKVFDIYNNPADRVKEIFSITRKKYSYKYTALRDIRFSIKKGEFIGILGRNGAGKSTLLKILSGQLTATEGTVEVKGTISLLQLGVGFNKELNGIDNIRFSSKILGHDESKVDTIINKVIEFADIGEFIYHPVKTYSSGMYSRLAFAIGITISPDILIIDEVLSVGDMRFSSKCLNKLHELKETGKTVVIVTHDVEKVAIFCDRAIWIKDAKIAAIGESKDIVEQYRDYMLMDKKINQKTASRQKKSFSTESNYQAIQNNILDREITWVDLSSYNATQKSNITITHAAVYNKTTFKRSSTFSRGDSILLYLKISSSKDTSDVTVGWNLVDKKGLIAVHSGSNFCGNNIKHLEYNKGVVCCFEFIVPPLRNSEYIFTFGIREADKITYKVNNVFPILIVGDDYNSQQGGYVILDNSSFYY